jgi:DNA-binding protein Alba
MSRPPNIVFIGKKPILTYLNATLTLLANEPVVTIKARGRSIITAVDVSQMIVKRMSAMGYKVSAVRIFSERLQSKDGKERNVSTIEVDVSRNQNAQ